MTVFVRSLAFYLPQFHRIAENDAWWGPGFTEWTNVSRSVPRYDGHGQPRLPADLGFYDLRVSESRQEQADLARQYGIDGFVYYHYWFNGRRLLNEPFDAVLAGGEPDLPFALCWANEDWRANWDGRSGEVLLHQEYSEDDDRAHIRFLIEAFKDPRYIRVNGKPLMLVYRVALLPNPARTAEIWREECTAAGIGEIHLCYVESMERIAGGPHDIGFDASVEFAPDWEQTGPARMDNGVEIHDYLEMAGRMLAKPDPGYRRYPCVTPGFDNTPRRPTAGYVVDGATPDLYRGWLTKTVQRDTERAAERGDDELLVFVNAWNEWAEGAILEPCNRFGRAYLEAHRDAVQSAAQPASATPLHPLSVVMVTTGGAEPMMQTLQSAVDTCGHVGVLQFVVVDNGSTDETQMVLAELSEEITSFRNDAAVAIPDAWLQGLNVVDGEFVVMVSADVALTDGWIDPIIAEFRRDPSCTAISPKIITNGVGVPSQSIAVNAGLCLVVRTSALLDGSVSEARVVDSTVQLTNTPVAAH